MPVTVVSPAFDLSVVESCARVIAFGINGYCGPTCPEVNRVAGCVGVGVRAVAELTEKVVSPAFDLSVVE